MGLDSAFHLFSSLKFIRVIKLLHQYKINSWTGVTRTVYKLKQEIRNSRAVLIYHQILTTNIKKNIGTTAGEVTGRIDFVTAIRDTL